MMWLVLREALILAISGIVIGIPASLLLGGFANSFLFGVQPFDIPALGITALLLVFFAALAGMVPARRASRLDPMVALRSE